MTNNDNQKLNGKEKQNRISLLKNKIKQLKNNDNPKDYNKIKNLEIELYELENTNKAKEISGDFKKNIEEPLVIKSNKKQKTNSISYKTLENKDNQINNLKKQIDKSNSKIKELTKNNELLKRENITLSKSKILENKNNQITSLKKRIEDLNNSINKQEIIIKKLSKTNLKILNSLNKNFKFLLYWNFLESNYKLKKDDLIFQKIEISKEKFLLSLREFLLIYKTTLNIEDDRFDIIKKVVQYTLKSTSCNQKDLILNLHKLAHVSSLFILKDKEESFIKNLFTESNYLLFFPNTKELKLKFKETHYEVLRSYYIMPTSSINLSPLVKIK